MENVNEASVSHNTLPVLPIGLTKEEIVTKANVLVDGLYLDDANPMASIVIAESIAAAQLFLETIRENPKFINLVRDIIGMDKEGYKTSSGATISQCETGIRYDFSKDPAWRDLKKVYEEATKELKDREALLKAIKRDDEVADAQHGGFLTPPTKTSTSNYKVSLKK